MAHVPVIGSINYKGGVGKTTTSRVAAQGFASSSAINKGKPVLIVDLDPQANTSRRWRLVEPSPLTGSVVPIPHPDLADSQDSLPYSSICDLWLDILGAGAQGLAPVPYKTSNPMIHVVPAHEDLMSQASRQSDEQIEVLGARMREWLRSPELAEQYCCVILDTQPTKSPLIDAALTASTHVYIPFIPEPQPVDGVLSMVTYVARHQTSRPDSDVPLRFLGLLPNMVRRVTLHKEILRSLERDPNFGRYLMPVRLEDRIGYAETDDYRNAPEQVTDLTGSNIEWEANRFVRYLWAQIEEDLPRMGHEVKA